ncbi:MAG TPA: argininosuccinate lyase [Armatimonadota bacterium]|nr:argininosuccinate lyase [Armatimonadota bacterium]
MSKLWSGRFSKETADLVDQFNASIGFDACLWECDIEGSIAHARMLGKCGIIPEGDAQAIVDGLKGIADDIRAGKVKFDVAAEDIHMNVEKLLHERVGEVAGKLHTARSRNDQVALDLRMYVKAQIESTDKAIGDLQLSLIHKAEEHIETVMPGYTHLQHAQPVTLAHHLLAYVWMLQRDRERFADCYGRTDVLPLGSGALAGTAFPIDREYVAKLLGFSRISENSMDAVSDRDFVVEFLSAASILGMHMSRFAEEIVLWNSEEFGFVELDDSVATGSSMMPQKKNPDVAELIRAKTGRLYGNLLALLTVLKGLPLTYNKDLQEDKEPLFDTADTVLRCLKVMRLLIETSKFRADVMARALEGGFSHSTDIADYLVKRGVPFRKAHEIVGRLVKYCIKEGKSPGELTPDELARFSDKLAGIDLPEQAKKSVEARDVPGGTSPGQVGKQIEAAKRAAAIRLL